MYISDRLVYLHMQKTGGNHIQRLLLAHDGGKQMQTDNGIRIKKHGPLTNLSRHTGKEIICSVRNPWAWYVSLWAFGCAKRGHFYHHLMATPQSRIKKAISQRSPQTVAREVLRYLTTNYIPRHEIDALYSDNQNSRNFRRWLSLVLGIEGKRCLPEEYSRTSVKEVVGFCTYRYLQLSTKHDVWQKEKSKLTTLDQVQSFFENHNIITKVIRTERLESDLSEILCSLGTQVSEQQLKALSATNTSVHRPYTTYYDSVTENLVLEREQLLIVSFGYYFGDS